MSTPPPDQPPAAETLEREPHEFVRGVRLWGQWLCRRCYQQFYYNIHKPSFAKRGDRTIKEGQVTTHD